MVQKFVRVGWPTVLGYVVGRSDCDPTERAAETDPNHIAWYCAAQPNSGIAAICDNIDHPLFMMNFELDEGMFCAEGRNNFLQQIKCR
ncbi:hypothetical protein ASG42_25745 [Rhizobium sp. Leaf391]|nr:hypothetical protein ASG42_25745 [Rhizobium sp. Leaf391]